jgi:hypothetical protein
VVRLERWTGIGAGILPTHYMPRFAKASSEIAAPQNAMVVPFPSHINAQENTVFHIAAINVA